MYYDLIASLPVLPYFEQASHLPISPLRLNQRLTRLRPQHAHQLEQAQTLVRWRPQKLYGRTDAEQVAEYSRLMKMKLDPPLREYIAFRMDQQTLLAALRRQRDGLGLPEGPTAWGVEPWASFIRRHWDKPDFGLLHLYPWLPQARELMATGNARGLERLLVDLAWRWLSQCAERNMFGFEAVFAFVFKWDMLQTWLVCDGDKAKNRFVELVDRVIHVERN